MSQLGGIGSIGGVGNHNFNTSDQIRSLKDVEPKEIIKLNNQNATEAGSATFNETLSNVLGEVNDMQLHAGDLIERFAAGEVKDLHEVIIAQQEAGIAFRMVQEIRNKLLESYQDLMRTQV